MLRRAAIVDIEIEAEWNVVIIGGGATGLGIAVDAAQRGYKTLLIEQADFAKGTSSKATKLVHGGVRYMAQGNIKLVREALKERAILLKNAPHVCSTQDFIIPCYSFFEKIKYGIGLKIYDLLSGKYSLGKTQTLSGAALKTALKLADNKIKGGVMYKDGQFDDARLAIGLAATATQQGATVINYCKAIALQKTNGKISGVQFEDELTGKTYVANATVVINATGVMVDNIMQLDETDKPNMVAPSQGVHIVVDKKFFNNTAALMVPKTKDGRVLFAVPWHNHVVIGTTDTPVPNINLEPTALVTEIEFILDHFNTYTLQNITKKDVLSVFVGLRPLVKKQDVKSTATLSRDHIIMQSTSGLWTITGGKWTTYRKMAADILNKIIVEKQLPNATCHTDNLPIIGTSHETEVAKLLKQNKDWAEKLTQNMPYTWAHVAYAIQNEMAQTVEDILARRTRILFLDSKAAISLAPKVATFMAEFLQKDEAWQKEQVAQFTKLANAHYSLQLD